MRLIARDTRLKVEVKLEAGHNMSRGPGDCRASGSDERGLTPRPWCLHLPADDWRCACPARMMPTHDGAEHLVREHTTNIRCARLTASSTMLVDARRSIKMLLPERATKKKARNCT